MYMCSGYSPPSLDTPIPYPGMLTNVFATLNLGHTPIKVDGPQVPLVAFSYAVKKANMQDQHEGPLTLPHLRYIVSNKLFNR